MIFPQAPETSSSVTAPSNFPMVPLKPMTPEELQTEDQPDELEVPDFIMNIGAGPKLDGKTPKQRRPPYIFPEGVPELDSAWEAAYGPPINENDLNARRYVRANPEIWEAIVLAAKRKVQQGERFSFRTLGEVIRWAGVKGFDENKPFKISNSYTSFFARYFCHFYPEVKNYIDFRKDI